MTRSWYYLLAEYHFCIASGEYPTWTSTPSFDVPPLSYDWSHACVLYYFRSHSTHDTTRHIEKSWLWLFVLLYDDVPFIMDTYIIWPICDASNPYAIADIISIVMYTCVIPSCLKLLFHGMFESELCGMIEWFQNIWRTLEMIWTDDFESREMIDPSNLL